MSGAADNNTFDNEEDDDLAPVIRTTRPSFIGRVQTLNNIKVIEWSFIILSAVSIATGFGFTLFRMSTITPASDQYVFAILVMVNLVFATFYLFHGIFQEQPFEILMYLFTTVVLGGLITINFASEETEKDKIRLIRFLITMILSLPNIIIGAKVGWQYWDSGALIFKTVGGDRKLQSICRTYFFGLSLLVFDAQAGISCTVLVMEKGVSGMSDEEIVILVTGAIFTVIWLTVGYVAMRTENLSVTWLFAFTSIVQPLYVLYLFVKGLEQVEGSYSIRTKSAFFSGAVLLVTHFTLLCTVCVIASNYGKGLKSAIYGRDSSDSGTSSRNGVSIEDDEEPLIRAGGSQGQVNYDAITPAP